MSTASMLGVVERLPVWWDNRHPIRELIDLDASPRPTDNMVMVPGHLLDKLRDRPPDHSLEREFYLSDEVLRADLEVVWHREWIFVALAAEVPLPGDYITTTVGDYPIIIIRDHDGVVRALHNVCRHRGSLVCDAERGTARRRLTCPYHQWSYGFDGALKQARRTSAGFDLAAHGLGRVACEAAGGMVFVSMADDPPDFAPMAELAGRYLAPFDLDRAQVAARSVTVEAANWKLVMENNRECYHCRGAHPELNATFPEAPMHSGNASGDALAALDHLVAVGESYGLPSRFETVPDLQLRAMRMPFVGDTRSMTIDGEPAVAVRFSTLPAVNLGDVLLYHYPSTWNHFMADHAVTFRIMPLDATHTRLTTTWLVPAGAVEGVDYSVDDLTCVWTVTNAQDAALVERTQLGVSSPAYRPGPYTPDDETGVAQFVDWYCQRMLGVGAPCDASAPEPPLGSAATAT